MLRGPWPRNKIQAFKIEYIRLRFESYGLRNKNPAPKVEYIRLKDVSGASPGTT